MRNIVRETREKRGMTISELSRQSGVSRQTIYNIETNPNWQVDASKMEAIAKALKCKVPSIFLFEV